MQFSPAFAYFSPTLKYFSPHSARRDQSDDIPVKRCPQCTAWFKKIDSISYVYISWTIYGMWMVYVTFERGGPKFSNTTARALAFRTAVQQRQLRAKCSTRFFAFVSSLKLSRRLLCSVRFVFVSTFNLQSYVIYVIFVTSSNFEI